MPADRFSNADPRNASRIHPTLTKIVATIGPASDSPEMIAKLIAGGVSVFRLNFSHGTLDEHATRLGHIRTVSERIGQPIGVLGDLQGPKIRVGVIAKFGVMLEAGQEVVFVASEVLARTQPHYARVESTILLPSDYEPMAREVKPGDRVLINDGAIRCIALPPEGEDDEHVLRVSVRVGGLVTSKKGINLPDSTISASALSLKDWECVEWAVAQRLDLLALSFVRNADEVRTLKKALRGMCSLDHTPGDVSSGESIPVIAKIEKPEAVRNIDAILEVADGIMVARGDLGVEMDLAQVPLIQRRLIAKADEWGKPCIVATQMLETMVTQSQPTRAEVSDVSHAVMENVDAVMLSAETASGKHPALVAETMRRVIAAAEADVTERVLQPSPSVRLVNARYRTAALAHGAWYVANDLGAKIIACWSQEGGTARYLSQSGMRIPIIAYSSDARQVRRMSLLRSVTPRLMAVPPSGKLADWNRQVEADLLELGWVKPGDPILLVAGKPLGAKGATNTLAVHYIGNTQLGFLSDR